MAFSGRYTHFWPSCFWAGHARAGRTERWLCLRVEGKGGHSNVSQASGQVSDGRVHSGPTPRQRLGMFRVHFHRGERHHRCLFHGFPLATATKSPSVVLTLTTRQRRTRQSTPPYPGGHRHTITLTQRTDESIKSGSEVTATSSSPVDTRTRLLSRNQVPRVIRTRPARWLGGDSLLTMGRSQHSEKVSQRILRPMAMRITPPTASSPVPVR